MNRTFVRFFLFSPPQLSNLKIILKKLADSIGLEPIRYHYHSFKLFLFPFRQTVHTTTGTRKKTQMLQIEYKTINKQQIIRRDLCQQVLTSYFSQCLFDFLQMKLHKKIKPTVFFQIRNQLFFDNLF